MKILNRKSTWQRLSYVPTWIVGTNYYDGKVKAGEQVILKPEPHNQVDPLAMAIYNQQEQQIGYLPRHDAAIFTPAVNNGEIMLKGTVTESTSNSRIALKLEVFIAQQAEKWLTPAFGDDIRAIYHNNLLNVWNNLDRYSSETVVEFRNSMRALAHRDELHYYTAILYRLLRGMVGELREAELIRYHKFIADRINQFGYGKQLGSRELTIFPLFKNSKSISRYKSPMRLPKQLGLTPENLLEHYPYPTGTVGVIYYAGGEMIQLCYYASAAKMQIEWFKVIEQVSLYADSAERQVKHHQLRRTLLKIIDGAEWEVCKNGNELNISAMTNGVEVDITAIDGIITKLTMENNIWPDIEFGEYSVTIG